jgi:hypothetical protein
MTVAKVEELRWNISGTKGAEEYTFVYGTPLGRPTSRWVDNIKIDLIEDGLVWTGLIWFRAEKSGGLL